MKKKVSCLVCLLSSVLVGSSQAVAAEQNGYVSVEDSGVSGIIDPEHPEVIVDPGEGPSTTGSLRIDYISTLNFGSENLNKSGREYDSLAQLFNGDTSARGYFVQISDFRPDDGWELQLTQKDQFSSSIVQDTDNRYLKGAVLSFDDGWANTNGTSSAPLVTRDAVSLESLDMAYTIATAGANEGKGSWTIAFGSSESNPQKKDATLTPFKDKNGEAVINQQYNKPEYKNSAISLTVPKETKIYPVEYSTTLQWTLLAGPT